MRLALLVLAVSALPALAEELSPPPVMPAEDPAPAGFLDKALRVDGKNRVTEGRAGAPVTHRELFQRLGRADLLQQSAAAAERRLGFLVGAAVAALAGVTTGAVLLGTMVNLATPACEGDVKVYNEVCVPAAQRNLIGGVASLAAGVALGSLFAGLAFSSDPAVLDRDGTTALVSRYNARLLRELRARPSSLRLMPAIAADGASLTASLRF
jgi:hypothetical protein